MDQLKVEELRKLIPSRRSNLINKRTKTAVSPAPCAPDPSVLQSSLVPASYGSRLPSTHSKKPSISLTPSLRANSRARTKAAYSPSFEGTNRVLFPIERTRAVIEASAGTVVFVIDDGWALSNADKSKGTVSSRLSHKKQIERISHDFGSESAG